MPEPDVRWIERTWHEQRRFVAAVLLAHRPPGVDLEDLLQEVAVRICSHAEELRDPEAARAWLRTVAVNTARSAGRRRRLEARSVERLDPARHDGGDPAARRDETAREAHETAQRTLAALDRLPEDYREPLLLKGVRGLTQKEIAALLAVPETTVETRLARARRLLRDELARRASPRRGLAAAPHEPPRRPERGEHS